MSKSPVDNSARKGRFGRPTAVTIGTYDGVHLGHRRLIAEAESLAAERHLAVVVVTFDRHPASVVRPQATPPLLTTLDLKLELLRATNVDDIVVLHFDAARAGESAEDFVTSVIVNELDARFVVVGANFRFGQGRKGDVELLEKMGAAAGFVTRGFALVTDENQNDVVSSTRIRRLVAEANLVDATALLGRPHEVRGVVAELSGNAPGLLGAVISPSLCMPPAGSYRALVGPVGSAGRATTIRVQHEESNAAFGNEIVFGTSDEPFVSDDGHPVPTGAWFSVQFLSKA